MPFNQSTLVGYVLQVAYTINFSEMYYIANATFLILFITICLHNQAFYKMFRHSLQKLDQTNQDRNVQKILCDLIHFHITTKELVFLNKNFHFQTIF